MTVPVLVFADRFSFCCWRFLAPGIVYQPLWEQTVWVRRLWPHVEIMDNKNQWRNLATIHQLPITARLVTCEAAHLLSKVWLSSKLVSTAGNCRQTSVDWDYIKLFIVPIPLKQGVIEEGGCTLIPFVYNTMAHNYCYHRLAYRN